MLGKRNSFPVKCVGYGLNSPGDAMSLPNFQKLK